MKPCNTEAIGTQKVVLSSGVLQACLAKVLKFSMPDRLVRSASWPFLNVSSEFVNGRHVMMSPAVPESSLALNTPLYWSGAVGWNLTVISGWVLLKSAIKLSQRSTSSVRQLSMVIVVPAALTAVAWTAMRSMAATAPSAPAFLRIEPLILPIVYLLVSLRV